MVTALLVVSYFNSIWVHFRLHPTAQRVGLASRWFWHDFISSSTLLWSLVRACGGMHNDFADINIVRLGCLIANAIALAIASAFAAPHYPKSYLPVPTPWLQAKWTLPECSFIISPGQVLKHALATQDRVACGKHRSSPENCNYHTSNMRHGSPKYSGAQ